jgi:hypothetical protein
VAWHYQAAPFSKEEGERLKVKAAKSLSDLFTHRVGLRCRSFQHFGAHGFFSKPGIENAVCQNHNSLEA